MPTIRIAIESHLPLQLRISTPVTGDGLLHHIFAPNLTKGLTQMARDLSEVRFLTVAEVADMMRVSRMTVYRLVHSGELPAIRFGRSFRVPETAVAAAIDAHIVLPEDLRGSDVG